MNNELSMKLLELRKDREWSQEHLAKELKVSQPTISRLENADKPIDDTHMLVRIARVMDRPVAEVVPAAVAVKAEFTAFCPNAFCTSNKILRLDDGTPAAVWKSLEVRPLGEYDEVVFCGHCRTRLMKECPKCGALIKVAGGRYCRKCGEEVIAGPTEEEMKKIERILEEREEAARRKAAVERWR